MRKVLILLLLVCNLGLWAAPHQRPKLILAIVVDQFRYDYLTRFRGDYHSGLERLIEHGAVFADAHHIAAPTVTAIGHSTFLSGATPSLSGIAGNEWYDRQARKTVTSVSDDAVKMIGGPAGALGSSPHNLLVSTVPDELKMQGRDSKAIGISIKDRGAILPVGHMADAAYWYDPDSNHWVTSGYYRDDLPSWVQKINSERWYARYIGASWFPFDAPEGKGKPYCTMVNGSEIPFCSSLEATPWGNDMIEEFAERALVEEKMGQHTGTDVLAVSFSSNDYVGHALGPDAPEVRDVSIRTDRVLGKLFDLVEKEVGAGRTLVVLTADHGVSPVPEVNQARRMPGGRLSPVNLERAVDEALVSKYGAGKWVAATSGPSIYLNWELIQSKKLDPAAVQDTAAGAMRKQPHAFRVYTAEEIMNGRVPEDFVTQAIRNGFFRQRSPDVIFLADPFFLFEATGTGHGTPFNYDTQVPVIFMGAGIKPGTYYQRAAVNDIAPTLAAILGLPSPSGSVGRILSEMFE
jgi:predicted AlkP superfamily pyrophosphatase or phosphodiesterase